MSALVIPAALRNARRGNYERMLRQQHAQTAMSAKSAYRTSEGRRKQPAALEHRFKLYPNTRPSASSTDAMIWSMSSFFAISAGLKHRVLL